MFLSTLLNELRAITPGFGLTQEEKDTLRLQWFRKIVRRSEIIEKEFMRIFL